MQPAALDASSCLVLDELNDLQLFDSTHIGFHLDLWIFPLQRTHSDWMTSSQIQEQSLASFLSLGCCSARLCNVGSPFSSSEKRMDGAHAFCFRARLLPPANFANVATPNLGCHSTTSNYPSIPAAVANAMVNGLFFDGWEPEVGL